MCVKSKNRQLLPVYIKGLAAGKYSLREASESTGYSVQWLWRLKEEYKTRGADVFENHNKGRVPKNKIEPEVRQRVAAIYAADYSQVNFSYFRDCLEEFEGIKLSYDSVVAILREFGQVSPESHKVKTSKVVHRPRLRRDCIGDLLQVDGTPFAWFWKFGDNKRYCICGAIDDATGIITGLYMTEYECLYNYLEVLRQTAKAHGIPRQIYSDRAAIFCFTPRGALAEWEKLEIMHEKRTQYQRICEELCITPIFAWSPEAKGRVERMWRTLQGQLPVWFFKRNISTVEAANAALKDYIKDFNKKYAVTPADDDNFFIDAPENLDDILTAQFKRKTDKAGCFMFQGTKFLVCDCLDPYHKDIILTISERGIYAKIKGVYYPISPVEGIQRTYNDRLPQCVEDIIYRYLFAFGKETSA